MELSVPIVKFAINNAVYASTSFTPFYINSIRHPALPLCLIWTRKILGREGLGKRLPPSSLRLEGVRFVKVYDRKRKYCITLT
ncbi:hypothetical protein Plhal304r1_c006g0024711 [Plasmopara halstedii]